MEVKNENLSLISACYSTDLKIERSKLCCNVESSTMEDSVFSGVNLSGSFFRQGEMRGVEFEQMGMANCSFKSTSMTRPDFTNVGMSGAMFSRTDMDRADFEGVGLINAIMSNCDLSGLTLRNCKIIDMTIDGYNVQELIEFYKNNHKGE